MPNWSYNTLTIRGKKEDVLNVFSNIKCEKPLNKCENLQEFLQKNTITMRSWLPLPKTFSKWDTTNLMRKRDSINFPDRTPMFATDEEYEKYCKGYKRAKAYQKKKYGVTGWYDYNCKTLGCKWNCELNLDHIESCPDEYVVVCRLNTPWSPPGTWYEWMFKNHSRDLMWSMECHEESNAYNFIGYWDKDSGYYEEDCESWFDYDDEDEE